MYTPRLMCPHCLQRYVLQETFLGLSQNVPEVAFQNDLQRPWAGILLGGPRWQGFYHEGRFSDLLRHQTPVCQISDPAGRLRTYFTGEHVQGTVHRHPEEAVSTEVLGYSSDGLRGLSPDILPAILLGRIRRWREI